MPNTEKQLTACQMLREKVKAKIAECGENPRTQYALGFKEALQMIESDWIPNESLPTERQQLEDCFNEAINDGRPINGETYYNETFKPNK